MSVEQLIGAAKVQGDLVSKKMKIRYQDTANIVPGQFVRIRLPKHEDSFVDLSNIYMCFYLQGSSSDTSACIDGQTIQTVVDRIRVLSGSTVISDTYECGVLFSSLYDVFTEVNESNQQKYQVGDMTGADKIAAFALAAPGRQYICKLSPRFSLLNTNALLPIGRMSELTVELTFNTAAKCIYSPANTLTSSFVISSFELHADYIWSQTISNHFNSNPFRITCTDYQWRINNLTAATNGAQVRLNSSNTSLDKVYNILRDGTTSQALNTQNKNRVAKNGNLINRYNLLCNGLWLYPDPVQGGALISQEIWEEFKDAFPGAYTSAFFDSTFISGTQSRIGVNFESAPMEFRKQLLSGEKTRDFTTDVILQIDFASATTARVDSFLCSSVTVSLPRNGDLKIEL